MDEEIRKIVEADITANARKHIAKAIARWGFEGTEDKIKNLYRCTPKLRDIMLREYNNILRRV